MILYAVILIVYNIYYNEYERMEPAEGIPSDLRRRARHERIHAY